MAAALVIICITSALLLFTMLPLSSRLLKNQTSDDKCQECLTPRPIIVDAVQFQKALKSASSEAYFDNIGMSDLLARSFHALHSNNSYRITYTKSLLLPDTDDPRIQRLFKLALKADELCLGHRMPTLAALPGIPWQFAILQNNAEGGMPHTHAGIVCLPVSFLDLTSESEMLRTLVHEKIHVLQRVRPDLTEAAVADAGYTRIAQRTSLDSDLLQHARSNPDVDGFVYQRKGRCTTTFLLNNHNGHPVSLSSTSAVCVGDKQQTGIPDEYEHPYEMMAYSLSELVVPR